MKKAILFIPLLLGGIVAIANLTVFADGASTRNQATESTSALPVVKVYKSATCGCCNKWIEHMRKNGFEVQAHDVNNLYPYKVQAKLGAGLGSCHTAFVDGYAIEGHVPADDVKRMLKEKPDISGLTVPAMPIGTPGMVVPGKPADPYQVISFKDGEQVGVFQDYPAE